VAGFFGKSRHRALQLGRPQGLGDRYMHGVKLMIARHLLGDAPATFVLEDDEIAHQSRKRRGAKTPSIITWISGRCGSASFSPAMVRQGLNHSRPAVSVPNRA
jgi:hypothetical protein